MRYGAHSFRVAILSARNLFLLVALGLFFLGTAGMIRAQDTSFTVTVAEKTQPHPYFGEGWNEGYVVDNVQGKQLTLVRGVTYTFNMDEVPDIHPFIITEDESGGSDATPYTQGVEGNDEGDPYAVPNDNPVISTDGPDEQYAYGFRNPYRFSFDLEGDNDLLVGDAGQQLWEEVSNVTAGGNYGWNVREGAHCFDAANPEDPPAECPAEDDEGDPLITPTIEFANSSPEGGLGQTVVGGYVYRGDMIEALGGDYIFGVWSRGRDDAGNREPGTIFVAHPQMERAKCRG